MMKWILLGAVVVMLLGVTQVTQLILPPPLVNLPGKALLSGAHVPETVAHILQHACQDCHSNHATLPWYANAPPLSWLITDDVARGRAFLDLSEWENYGKGRRLGILASMANATEKRRMPPRFYTIVHADARLSDADRKQITDWAKQEYRRIRSGM